MKHLLLDLGGVVFESSGRESQFIQWKQIGKLNHQYGHDLNLGKDYFADFLRDYNHLTGQHLSGEAFLQAIFDTLDFNHTLVDCLQKRFHLHILSDNYRENITYISHRYEFHRWSETQFYSFQYGMTKSDPRLFEKVLDEIGVIAEDVVFIDDDINNIRLAQNLGITGIQFVNNAQIFKEIEVC
ncbi:MAG: HAD-IA family hydrolase [Bacteroidota bacterium]